MKSRRRGAGPGMRWQCCCPYSSDPQDCRSASRYGVTSRVENRADPEVPKSPWWLANGLWIGFRVVSPVEEPDEAEKLKFWDAQDEVTKAVLEKHHGRYVQELIEPPPRDAAGGEAK